MHRKNLMKYLLTNLKPKQTMKTTINQPANLVINSLNNHDDLEIIHLPILPDNDQIIDIMEKTLNELIAMDSIKHWNIQYHNISLPDESHITIYSIPLSPADTMAKINDETFEDLFEILFSTLPKESKPEGIPSHSIIIHDIETLEIHYNDNTINIIYHYTGQW